MDNFVEYCKKREGDLVGSQLDNEDLIDYERMQEYWTDYVKLFIPVVSDMLPDEIDGFLNYIRETCITDCNDWHNLLHNKQFDSNHELYKQYLKDKK